MKKGGHMIHYVGSFSNLELQNGRCLKCQRRHYLVISKHKWPCNTLFPTLYRLMISS